jgi:hypothetical protein
MFVPRDPQAAITNALASCEVPDPVLVVDWFEELFTAGEAVAARAGHRPSPDGTHASCRSLQAAMASSATFCVVNRYGVGG